MWLVTWWWVMNCVSERCCVVLEICCFEHVINVKVWNAIFWLNPWDKWCYVLSVEMIQIVLSWACYTYIMCVCYLYMFRNVITHSLCVVCVWILWWSRTLCSWEQRTRWIALRNLVLEDTRTQYSNRMWHRDMSFCFNCMMFWTWVLL